jgi:hypothetical protein
MGTSGARLTHAGQTVCIVGLRLLNTLQLLVLVVLALLLMLGRAIAAVLPRRPGRRPQTARRHDGGAG